MYSAGQKKCNFELEMFCAPHWKMEVNITLLKGWSAIKFL